MDLKVGIQLYSVKEAMGKDPVEAVRQVAKVGYKNLEAANHRGNEDFGVGFGVDAAAFRGVLEETGTNVFCAHLSPFHEGNCREVIRYHQAIGNHRIANPMEFFTSKDDVLRKCEAYNKMGRICKEEGITYLYHNHFHEFQQFEGKTVLDWILENTDPDCLGFELDTFWAMRGGQDPIQVMKKLGSRLKLVHQKDYSKTPGKPVDCLAAIPDGAVIDMERFQSVFAPEDFTEIGTGVMDIQRIIDTARELGSVEYIVLEQDCSAHPEMESIAISLENFRRYSGLIW